MSLNGRAVSFEAHPGEKLVEVLRRENCFSVKRGCDDGNCGTCVVQVNGAAVNSCLMLAMQAEGAEVWTTEGLGTPRSPHPIQEAFVEAAAVQCGFCTPGILMSTKALLEREPHPTDGAIKEALDGNLCRCTGYVKSMDAVRDAADRMNEEVSP